MPVFTAVFAGRDKSEDVNDVRVAYLNAERHDEAFEKAEDIRSYGIDHPDAPVTASTELVAVIEGRHEVYNPLGMITADHTERAARPEPEELSSDGE